MPVTFIWPGLLWGLLLVPAVLALYVRLLRRALPASLPHPVTPLVAIAASHGKRFTRYLPAALLLLALTSALVAAARPGGPALVPAAPPAGRPSSWPSTAAAASVFGGICFLMSLPITSSVMRFWQPPWAGSAWDW